MSFRERKRPDLNDDEADLTPLSPTPRTRSQEVQGSKNDSPLSISELGDEQVGKSRPIGTHCGMFSLTVNIGDAVLFGMSCFEVR